MKRIICLLLSLFAIFAFSGCFSTTEDSSNQQSNNKSSASKYEFVGNTNMVVDDTTYGYSVSVQGKIKNTSNKSYSYISVQYALYDSENNQIETASDYLSGFAAGDTWQFNAKIIGWLDEEPSSFKLIKVTVL